MSAEGNRIKFIYATQCGFFHYDDDDVRKAVEDEIDKYLKKGYELKHIITGTGCERVYDEVEDIEAIVFVLVKKD